MVTGEIFLAIRLRHQREHLGVFKVQLKHSLDKNFMQYLFSPRKILLEGLYLQKNVIQLFPRNCETVADWTKKNKSDKNPQCPSQKWHIYMSGKISGWGQRPVVLYFERNQNWIRLESTEGPIRMLGFVLCLNLPVSDCEVHTRLSPVQSRQAPLWSGEYLRGFYCFPLISPNTIWIHPRARF